MAIINLNLYNRIVVFVGGGKITARRIPSLLVEGANVTVISPQLSLTINSDAINWIPQDYYAHYLDELQPVLVFAATDSPVLNQQIADDARRIGAWVNVVSDASASDFHNLATLENPPLTIAISTGGTSPALLNIIKARIVAALGDDLPTLAAWLGELRPQARTTLRTQAERQALYTHILHSDVPQLLQRGKVEAARSQFESLVAEVFA